MKPISRFTLFLLQISEPIQMIWFGGSQMAYLRWQARNLHDLAHCDAMIDAAMSKIPWMSR